MFEDCEYLDIMPSGQHFAGFGDKRKHVGRNFHARRQRRGVPFHLPDHLAGDRFVSDLDRGQSDRGIDWHTLHPLRAMLRIDQHAE